MLGGYIEGCFSMRVNNEIEGIKDNFYHKSMSRKLVSTVAAIKNGRNNRGERGGGRGPLAEPRVSKCCRSVQSLRKNQGTYTKNRKYHAFIFLDA